MDDFTIDFGAENIDLTTYQQQLKRELSRITQSALTQWANDSDNAFQQALAGAIAQATNAAYEEILGSVTGAATGKSGSGSDKFSNAISDLVVAKVNSILFPTRTHTSSRETERSQQAEAAFRLSRSQQQAEQTRTSLQGQRNL